MFCERLGAILQRDCHRNIRCLGVEFVLVNIAPTSIRSLFPWAYPSVDDDDDVFQACVDDEWAAGDAAGMGERPDPNASLQTSLWGFRLVAHYP